MPSVASVERYALQPPEHHDTEQALFGACGCPAEEDDYCKHCQERLNYFEPQYGGFNFSEMAIMPFCEVVAECVNSDCISNKKPTEVPF